MNETTLSYMEMRRFLRDFVGFGPVTDQSRESSQQDQVFSYLPRRHAACVGIRT